MSGNVVNLYQQAPRDFTKLREEVNARMVQLETIRYSWWLTWRDLGAFLLPRRYRWLVTPSQWNRGSQINQNILDPTGSIALRDCAAGMMSGTTSPTRPWFKVSTDDDNLNKVPEVAAWLSATTQTLLRIMARSNYYVAKAVQHYDNTVFGTAPMLIYDDPEKVIHCYNPMAGEYYCANGPKITVDTLYRKLTLTADQMVRKFGYENCSVAVQQAWTTRGAILDQEWVIGHAIEPNPDFVADGGGIGKSGVPRHFQFREVWWDMADPEKPLRVTGFFEQPFSCPRWDQSGNDAYGRSPGWDMLGLVKQLQLETKRKAQSIDKMVNPPMAADVSMKNEPAALLPGSVTYVPNLNGGVGFRPVYQVIPPIKELKDDIADVRENVKKIAYNDLFKMISELDTVRTAAEIYARKEEQLVLLGPTLERNQTEGLDPDINRIFRIAVRRGLIQPMPPQLRGDRGAKVRVQYESMLAAAQRASSTGAINQLLGLLGNVAGMVPQAIDNINVDEMVTRYADLLGVDPTIINGADVVAAIRQKREDAQRAQAAIQTGSAAAQGAETLSKADMGGNNALTALVGGGGR